MTLVVRVRIPLVTPNKFLVPWRSGSATPRHGEGHKFKSCRNYQYTRVTQWTRVLRYERRSRRFKSFRGCHLTSTLKTYNAMPFDGQDSVLINWKVNWTGSSSVLKTEGVVMSSIEFDSTILPPIFPPWCNGSTRIKRLSCKGYSQHNTKFHVKDEIVVRIHGAGPLNV